MTRVSLPMYDWPEVHQLTDRLWRAVASVLNRNGFDCPQMLDRTSPVPDLWQGEDCLFSQTCGWPYISNYQNLLTLIVTPHYGVSGCKGAYNSSRIICRRDDNRQALEQFEQATAVINALDSQSGHQALKSTLVEARIQPPFFRKCLISEAHRASIHMVAESEADIAAIDPVSWHLARRYDRHNTDRLRVLTQGPYTPGLPMVCSHSFKEAMRATHISEQLCDLFSNELEPAVLDGLCITGGSQLEMADYQVLESLDHSARQAGYCQLTSSLCA